MDGLQPKVGIHAGWVMYVCVWVCVVCVCMGVLLCTCVRVECIVCVYVVHVLSVCVCGVCWQTRHSLQVISTKSILFTFKLTLNLTLTITLISILQLTLNLNTTTRIYYREKTERCVRVYVQSDCSNQYYFNSDIITNVNISKYLYILFQCKYEITYFYLHHWQYHKLKY